MPPVVSFLRASCRLIPAFLAALLPGLLLAASPAGLEERPLAAPQGPKGPTLFSLLPAARTGLVTENKYNDPRMWGDLYHEFEVGEIGTGVAVGDYDGDGRPDIFVVSKTESCRLFRNLGDYKFQDVTAQAGVGDQGAAAGIWKQGACFADVNNDGRLDLYVCRFAAPNLLYINQGDGTFKEQAKACGLDVTDSSVMAAFCDYDRDGWLDVFVQTNLLDDNARRNGQRNYLFHNNRNGTFTNVTDAAGIAGEAQGHAAVWWDCDHDGWPDLYVANDFAAPDKLYRNNHDGTFSNVIDQVVPHMPFSSMGADVGDVNNDGRPDLLVADMAASTHEKDQRGMVDTRSQAAEPADDSTVAPQTHHNVLYLATGTGRYLEAAFLAGVAATDWTWSVRFEDLDNDGRLDLHVTNGMHREATNTDLLVRQMAAESPVERLRIMRDSPVMKERNFAFRNLGDLRFEDVSAAWGLDQRGVSFGAAFGDFGGTGNLDVVFTNYQEGLTFLRNEGSGGHRVTIALRGTGSNRFGIGANVRIETASGVQVRPLVVARGILSSSEPIAHFGLGSDERIKRLTVTWPDGRCQSYDDLAADRHFTITETATTAPEAPAGAPRAAYREVSQEIGFGLKSTEAPIDETVQQQLLPWRLNRRGPALAVGDIDGDGREEVVVGGTTATPARIFHASAGGGYSTSEAAALPVGAVNDGPVLLFDADGDGDNDLFISKAGNSLPADAPEYQPQLWLNDGHGGFSPAPADALPPLPFSAGAVVAVDCNRDGRLDLFIGTRLVPGLYPDKPRSALLLNRGGRFEDVTDSFAPALRQVGLVTAALWSDVDADGWPDLLVATEWGAVNYFHNEQGRRLEDWTEKGGFAAAGRGWWTALAAGDFNHDGRLDYVAGNVGLNTRYHADAAHPARLYAGDFTGEGGVPQLVEAHYEGERLYPRRSRKELGASIPAVTRKYPRNDFFARATLPEIFSQAKLDEAVALAAGELRSGVFLSQPDGTHRFEPLPRLAQIAPAQGMAVGDFDGDGQLDLYLVQNSYAPVPAIGRFDAGLSQLLLGDGQGGFTPVSPGESNLVVPGDAKALTQVDFDQDGRGGFLVTRNNGTTLAFRATGPAGRRVLAVRLRETPGHPAAGARLTVEFKAGPPEVSEIFLGGAQGSQSSATTFVAWREANPPTRVSVRWTSGATSEQGVPDAVPATLLLSPP